MKDCTNGKLQEALEFAKKMKNNSLQDCLDRLKKTEENYKQNTGRDLVTYIYPDFAPLSFYFEKFDCESQKVNSNGGIIYHGPHDGFGSGAAPTFSVCLTPTDGWSIHT